MRSGSSGRALIVAASSAVLGCAGNRATVRPLPAVTGASGAAAIAAERGRAAATAPEHSVAVLPMLVVARDTTLAPLGFGIADLLSTDLARSRRLVVVERARLDAVADELRLARAGQLDAASAPRGDRLVGARRIVVGTIAEGTDGELVIDARIANTATGVVEGAFTARAPASDLLRAEKAIALRLFESLGVVLTPGERLAIEQAPSPALPALVAYGDAVRAEWRGDFDGAAARFRAASQANGLAFARERAARGRAVHAGAARARTALATATRAVNPSPAAAMGEGTDATTAQAKGAAQDRAVTAQMQAVLASLVVQVRTVP